VDVINISYKSTNSYLIPCDTGWLMIDTGCPDTFSQLLQSLYQHNIAITEIDYLVITHFHPGHAGLTQHLRDFGTNLIVHEYQLPYMNKLNLQFKRNQKANFRDIVAGNNIVVTDKESRSFFKTIGIDGELLSTPGHSDDSVSLLLDNHYAFIGDLPSLSLLEDTNDLTIYDSWDILQRHNVTNIYPGHGTPYEV